MKMRRKYSKSRKTHFPFLLVGLLLIGLVFVFSLKSLAEPLTHQVSPEEEVEVTHDRFIEHLVPHAKELQEGYGILPSIILAQAILESNWGQSTLASEYHNLFGVKAFGHPDSVSLETQEYFDGQWVTIQGDFRVYKSWEESMDDHTMLFVNGVDWSPEKYVNVLTAPNYEAAADALQEAGYATDPTYAEKIKEVIQAHHLSQYDQ